MLPVTMSIETHCPGQYPPGQVCPDCCGLIDLDTILSVKLIT
jgi:hypothetical protein